MKKTLLLVLAVCLIAVMVPAASFALSEGEQGQDGAVLDEVLNNEEGEQTAEQQYINYESKMSLQDGEPGWQQDPSTKNWKYWDGSKFLTDKQQIGGSFYYFDDQGVLKTGWVKLLDGNYNYYDPTPGTPGALGSTFGVMKTGWLTVGKYKYYLNPAPGSEMGARMYGLQPISGSKYFLNVKSGALMKGAFNYSGHKYLADSKTGKLRTGWVTASKKKYYYDPTNCYMKTGWLTLNNSKYYLDAKTGVMKTGWQTIKSKKYYFASNGKMTTGFKTISKKKYYFKSNGVMATGGPITIKGDKYIFTSKGVMRTGAIKVNGVLYYFFSSGKAVKNTGWFKGSDKKQRYSIGGGKVAVGQRQIGNNWYVFNSTTGVLISSMDAIDRAAQSCTSSTKYLIRVVRSKHIVRVYSGKKNNWKRLYSFTCSVGKTSYPTPLGVFKIQKKDKVHVTTQQGEKVRCWGRCKFTTDPDTGVEISLNSILYRVSDGSVFDGRLGGNVTAGPVRLAYNNAMWIYNNCPLKTAVYVVA